MNTTITIISLKDVMELYGLSRKQATRLLNTKGCSDLQFALIQNIQDEFEQWLRSRKV